MRFIRSSSTTLIFKTAAMICGFAISVLIARILGPAGRGLYGLVMTVIVLSSTCGLFGLAGANIYLIAREKKRARAMGTQSIIVGIVGSLLAISALFLINRKFPNVFAGMDGTLFRITLTLIPVFLWGTLFSYAFLGNGNIVAFSMFEAGQRAIFLAVGLVILVLLDGTLATYLTSVSLCLYAIVIGYVVWYYLSSECGPLFDRTLLSPATAYGIRSYVATVVTYAVMRSGIFFVNYFLDTSQAGFFAVAQQMAELLVIIPSVVATVLFPRVARGDSKDLTARVTRTAIAVFLPVFVVLGLARNVMVAALFGPEFLPSSQVFLVFLPGTFLLGLEAILAADIAGRGYPWPAALAWIPVLALNVGGFIVLIPRFGINGAAFSCTISFSVIFVFMLLYYRKLSGQSFSSMFIIRREDIDAVFSILRVDVSVKSGFRQRYDHDKTVRGQDSAEIEKVGPKA